MHSSTSTLHDFSTQCSSEETDPDESTPLLDSSSVKFDVPDLDLNLKSQWQSFELPDMPKEFNGVVFSSANAFISGLIFVIHRLYTTLDTDLPSLHRQNSTTKMRRTSSYLTKEDQALKKARLSIFAPGQARIHFAETETPYLDFVKHHFHLVYVCFHITIGLLFFRFYEHERLIEAMYYIVCIFTTVGYGDFEGMHAEGTKFFLMLYSMASVAFLASAISKEFESAFSEHHKKLTFVHGRDMDEVLEVEEEMGLWERIKTSDLGHFMLWIIWLIVGSLAVGTCEGWNWSSALYFAVMSATTVGFGAKEPDTDLAKGISVIYLPVLIFLTTSLVSKAYYRFRDHLHVDLAEFQQHLTHIFDPTHFEESIRMMVKDHNSSFNFSKKMRILTTSVASTWNNLLYRF